MLKTVKNTAPQSLVSKTSFIKAAATGIIAALLLIFTTIFILSVAGVKKVDPILDAIIPAKAYAGLVELPCGSEREFGLNMDSHIGIQSLFYPAAPNATSRRWTVQEAFAQSVFWTQYYGETSTSEYIIKDVGNRGTGYGKFDEIKSKLDGHKDFSNCYFRPITVHISNMLLGLASLNSAIASFFASTVFSPNFICTDPSNPTGGCINLLSFMAGTGNPGEGIIGQLTNSLYLPLAVILVALGALSVAWSGLFRRQLREALMSAIWIVASFVVGVIMLFNPMMLAKFPTTVSTGAVSCVVGAFSGYNCFDGTAPEQKNTITVNTECQSNANTSNPTDLLGLTANMMSCQVWKTFVLSPWAAGQFGKPYNQLYTQVPAADGGIQKTSLPATGGISDDAYCINLGTSGSWESFVKPNTKRVDFDGGDKICNMALYQLYVMSNTSSTVNKDSWTWKDTDKRWFNLIVPAASDDETWQYWAPSGGTTRFTHGFMALLGSLVGGLVIVVISFTALIYYLSSIILMIFAPVFMLLALHPTRGKKLFLGWLEKVGSAIVKFIVSAVFLLITLSLYSAALSSADVGMGLLFSIIIAGVMLVYRKEIIDMVGKVDLGGKQLSSAFMDKIKSGGDKVKDLGLAAGAGAVGAKFAGGTFTGGMQDGAMRELRRGTGAVSNMARSADRQSRMNERDARLMASEVAKKAEEAKAEAQFWEEQEKAASIVGDAPTEATAANKKIEEATAARVLAENNYAQRKDFEKRTEKQIGAVTGLNSVFDANKMRVEIELMESKAREEARAAFPNSTIPITGVPDALKTNPEYQKLKDGYTKIVSTSAYLDAVKGLHNIGVDDPDMILGRDDLSLQLQKNAGIENSGSLIDLEKQILDATKAEKAAIKEIEETYPEYVAAKKKLGDNFGKISAKEAHDRADSARRAAEEAELFRDTVFKETNALGNFTGRRDLNQYKAEYEQFTSDSLELPDLPPSD